MRRFEAYLIPGGDIEICYPDTRETILLDSEEGLSFAGELIEHLECCYPTMILAVEQKIKRENKSLYAVMKSNRTVYLRNVVQTVCACCFGERDRTLDYDGCRFNTEYPDKCRDFKYCPWNGYAERNADSFMVICGAKREYGFTPSERRLVMLVKKGYVNPSILASAMSVTQKSIWNYLNSIYKKTGVAGMPELINLVKDENI